MGRQERGSIMESEKVTDVIYHPQSNKTLSSKWKNETLYSVTLRCEERNYWGVTVTFQNGERLTFCQLADGWNKI